MALTTKRIINLPTQNDPQSDDYLVIDNGTNGTHKIPVERIGVELDDTLSVSGKAADAKATGDAIDALGSQLEVTGTASGAIATFSDGSTMPAKSVVVNIEPQQSGTGTPSPDNVRSISGWESVNVNVASENLCSNLEQGYWAFANGSDGSSDRAWVRTPKVACEPNTSYTASAQYRKSRWQGFVFWDSNNNYISSNSTNTSKPIDYTATTPSNAAYMAFNIAEDGANTHIVPSDVKAFGIYRTDELTITTTSLGRTVYGGTLDVVSGELTSYPFYPSYNGETLNGRWICDRAVYAEGTTPPTGSQVALISGTGTTYTLTPTQINTLLGENNVWADCGDVSVVYVRDLNIAINNLIGE